MSSPWVVRPTRSRRPAHAGRSCGGLGGAGRGDRRHRAARGPACGELGGVGRGWRRAARGPACELEDRRASSSSKDRRAAALVAASASSAALGAVSIAGAAIERPRDSRSSRSMPANDTPPRRPADDYVGGRPHAHELDQEQRRLRLSTRPTTRGRRQAVQTSSRRVSRPIQVKAQGAAVRFGRSSARRRPLA